MFAIGVSISRPLKKFRIFKNFYSMKINSKQNFLGAGNIFGITFGPRRVPLRKSRVFSHECPNIASELRNSLNGLLVRGFLNLQKDPRISGEILNNLCYFFLFGMMTDVSRSFVRYYFETLRFLDHRRKTESKHIFIRGEKLENVLVNVNFSDHFFSRLKISIEIQLF